MSIQEKPYIGVTGITSPEDAREVSNIFKENNLVGADAAYQGMVGYLVGSRTFENSTRGSSRYPSLFDLSGLLEQTKGTAFNTFHYYTPRRDQFGQQVIDLFQLEDIYDDNLCRGLQLNFAWPSVAELARVKRVLPDLKIILQLGAQILNQPIKVVRTRLPEYRELINYVLIDPSGGTGERLNMTNARRAFDEIQTVRPDATVIFAGGFSPDTVVAQVHAIRNFTGINQFGIDAETGLRTGRDFDIQKARFYIEQAAALCR